MKETITKAELEEGLKNIRSALISGNFTHGARRKMQTVKTHVRTLLNVHSDDSTVVKSGQIKSIRATFNRCKQS